MPLVKLIKKIAFPKPTAVVFGVENWKVIITSRLSPEYDVIFLPSKKSGNFSKVYHRQLKKIKNKNLFVWGYKWAYETMSGFEEYVKKYKIPVYILEDGFVRSVGLGRDKTQPISICKDSKGIYYDARKESELENILSNYDFVSDHKLMAEAKECMDMLLNFNISKYNNVKVGAPDIYGPKTRKRILVVGQVEEDASIKYGCQQPITNNALAMIAYRENPDAEIIYKPHPDVLFKKRSQGSDPAMIEKYVKVIREPLSLADSFKTIDHVYTITSLAGFEALMRGIKVTTFGCPFYAGWGLTDDRQPNSRRTKKHTVLEIFAAAYLLYTKYFDINDRTQITLKDAINQVRDLSLQQTA